MEARVTKAEAALGLSTGLYFLKREKLSLMAWGGDGNAPRFYASVFTFPDAERGAATVLRTW